MDAKDYATLIAAISAALLAFAGVLLGILSTSKSAGKDRKLQARTQLRQAALAPLDKLRQQLDDRIRDRQQQLAHLHADKDIVEAVHAIIEQFVDERSSSSSGTSVWFPAAMALEPPTFEQTRVFTLAEAQPMTGDDLMAQLQAYWRWWHLYDGLLAQRDRDGVDGETRRELDARTFVVLEEHLGPTTKVLPDLFASKIDSLERSLQSLARDVSRIDDAERQILAQKDEEVILRECSEATRAARTSLLDDVAPR